ncbi:MAG TPA: YkgJ family cysteine cluster protein [Verrucomicrobiae bacterium]|nr:YkgJ family cysteine cluster protein [Verrucomicrobiae bacterium]
MDAIEQLCPNCGLCCNGTLFADVELRKGDDAKQLEKSGLTLFQKTKTKVAFSQPCNCFDGKLCKIYSVRPTRCRLFECGLLKKVQAGEMTVRTALAKISRAKKSVKKVRKLLRSSAERDERLTLSERYSRAMSAPIDLAKGNSKLRGELLLTFSDLMELLQHDFLA